MIKNGKRVFAKKDCPLLAMNELHQLLSLMRLLFIRGSLRKNLKQKQISRNARLTKCLFEKHWIIYQIKRRFVIYMSRNLIIKPTVQGDVRVVDFSIMLYISCTRNQNLQCVTVSTHQSKSIPTLLSTVCYSAAKIEYQSKSTN